MARAQGDVETGEGRDGARSGPWAAGDQEQTKLSRGEDGGDVPAATECGRSVAATLEEMKASVALTYQRWILSMNEAARGWAAAWGPARLRRNPARKSLSLFFLYSYEKNLKKKVCTYMILINSLWTNCAIKCICKYMLIFWLAAGRVLFLKIESFRNINKNKMWRSGCWSKF